MRQSSSQWTERIGDPRLGYLAAAETDQYRLKATSMFISTATGFPCTWLDRSARSEFHHGIVIESHAQRTKNVSGLDFTRIVYDDLQNHYALVTL